MDTNAAAEHLHVIRTLMERTVLYRRALAPICTLLGIWGTLAAVVGWRWAIHDPRPFAAYWMGVALGAVGGAFLLARRQALKAAEAFWSPPTRRVTQASAPALCAGLAVGVVTIVWPGSRLVPEGALPAFWALLYGCALHAAGFFMARGIRWLGWLFIASGVGVLTAASLSGATLTPRQGHAAMGLMFGGLHLAYGFYLYLTERRDGAA
jgi:hypothetical protein